MTAALTGRDLLGAGPELLPPIGDDAYHAATTALLAKEAGHAGPLAVTATVAAGTAVTAAAPYVQLGMLRALAAATEWRYGWLLVGQAAGGLLGLVGALCWSIYAGAWPLLVLISVCLTLWVVGFAAVNQHTRRTRAQLAELADQVVADGGTGGN